MTIRWASLLFALAALCGFARPSHADWPHLRGPNYDGVSSEVGLADSWPDGGPRQLWSRDLGQGHSGIIIGDGKLTMDFSRELFKEGVMGTGIAFPTVPEGKARIRTIMTATHTEEELRQALEVLGRVGKKMGILV